VCGRDGVAETRGHIHEWVGSGRTARETWEAGLIDENQFRAQEDVDDRPVTCRVCDEESMFYDPGGQYRDWTDG
jgi:hypothetical protein